MVRVNIRYISPKREYKSFSLYLVNEWGGWEGGDKCIYLHQHSIKKIKQHVLKSRDREQALGVGMKLWCSCLCVCKKPFRFRM